jgi:hypothetical protein
MPWHVIQYITSALTLAAFLASLVAWAYRRRLLSRERQIQSAPERDRPKLAQKLADDLHIEVKEIPVADMSTTQRYRLVMEKIRQEERRLYARLLTAVVALALCLVASVWSVTSVNGGQLGGLPPEVRNQGPSDARNAGPAPASASASLPAAAPASIPTSDPSPAAPTAGRAAALSDAFLKVEGSASAENLLKNPTFKSWPTDSLVSDWALVGAPCDAALAKGTASNIGLAVVFTLGRPCPEGGHVYLDQLIDNAAALKGQTLTLGVSVMLDARAEGAGPEIMVELPAHEGCNTADIPKFCSPPQHAQGDVVRVGKWSTRRTTAQIPQNARSVKVRLNASIPKAGSHAGQPRAAILAVEEHGFRFELTACRLRASVLRCPLAVSNLRDSAACLSMKSAGGAIPQRNSATPSTMRDNADRAYTAASISRGNLARPGEFDMEFSPKDRSDISLTFNGVNPDITFIKDLQLGSNLCGWTGFRPSLYGIPVVKSE